MRNFGNSFRRTIATLLSVLMLANAAPLQAAVLASGTAQAATAMTDTAGAERAQLVARLVEAGVDADWAGRRVAELPAADVAELSARLDALPAGAGHSVGFWAAIAAFFGFLFGWMLGKDDRGGGHHHGRGHGHGHH